MTLIAQSRLLLQNVTERRPGVAKHTQTRREGKSIGRQRGLRESLVCFSACSMGNQGVGNRIWEGPDVTVDESLIIGRILDSGFSHHEVALPSVGWAALRNVMSGKEEYSSVSVVGKRVLLLDNLHKNDSPWTDCNSPALCSLHRSHSL